MIPLVKISLFLNKKIVIVIVCLKVLTKKNTKKNI